MISTLSQKALERKEEAEKNARLRGQKNKATKERIEQLKAENKTLGRREKSRNLTEDERAEMAKQKAANNAEIERLKGKGSQSAGNNVDQPQPKRGKPRQQEGEEAAEQGTKQQEKKTTKKGGKRGNRRGKADAAAAAALAAAAAAADAGYKLPAWVQELMERTAKAGSIFSAMDPMLEEKLKLEEQYPPFGEVGLDGMTASGRLIRPRP